MKIAILHCANHGFFPRFYEDLHTSIIKNGDDVRLFVPNSGQNRRVMLPRQQIWGYKWNWFLHFHLYKLTGLQDMFSLMDTIDLIKKIKRYSPDIIHMNIVNQWQINFPILVKALNKMDIPIIWTQHDTRAFTGRCMSFEEAQCFKWKEGCGDCPKEGLYEKSYIDNTKLQWKFKKKIFTRFKRMLIVTPSQWLANCIKESILNIYPLIVLNNGIDTESFSNIIKDTCIPELKNVKGKKILLGVATIWNHRKGLDTFIWLSKMLSADFQIVLVGDVAHNRVGDIPSNIICIQKTTSKKELISIFQSSFIYINPTLADNFPTVNIEALASGLPLVTFDTGGSAECLDESCGISVRKGDNEGMLNAILEITAKPEKYRPENSIERANNFSLYQFDKYVNLYHKLVQ